MKWLDFLTIAGPSLGAAGSVVGAVWVMHHQSSKEMRDFYCQNSKELRDSREETSREIRELYLTVSQELRNSREENSKDLRDLHVKICRLDEKYIQTLKMVMESGRKGIE